MYLPHRIPATHVRWRYVQDPAVQVATGQTWNIAICDASGRLIGQTGAVAFAGGTSTSQRIAAPFNPALPAGYVFDAGWYYVWAGISALGATQTCFFTGYSVDNQNFTDGGSGASGGGNPPIVGAGDMPPVQNLAFRNNTGGTTFDASNTILNMADCYADTGLTTCLPIPQIALSIG